ncbi:ead/Ea22-like family protein [Escherichia coli]|nr:ead/Ea22-like family protein [Escherichia coli]MCO4870137.1 ead/Ea22-like family protein [Escherichia coli]
MSEINYQALREAAEKATWGDWDSYKPHRGARGYEVRLSSQAIAQHVLKNNAEFIAAFNPKVALALLDEREKNQQYIKLRDQENEDIALTVGKLRVELEAAENNLIDSECHVAELEEALRDKQALLEASEKRIAELEAREVVLPRAHDVHPLGPQSAKIFCEFHRSIVNRCDDEIRKVGVKVSIKGN